MLNITNFYNMIEQGTTGGYNPLGSSKLIESWLSYAGTTTDGGGLVSAWEGQKAGKNFTAAIAAKQPTLTATKFGTLPGLVFDGIGNVMRCLTVGALISGNTSLTVIMVLFSPGTGDEIHSEFATTSWFTEAGTWTMASVATNTVIAACRGDVGNVIWTGNDNVAPLVVPGILTSTFNFTLATNEALPMELDNVVLAGTYSTNSNNTSTFSNKNLSIGARANGTPATFSSMTLGAIAIYQGLTVTERTDETRGLGALFGGIVVA